MIALLLGLGTVSAVIISISRSVDVRSLFANRDGTNIEVRIFEGNRVPTTVLHAKSGDNTVTRIQQVFEDGRPEWRLSGRRADLSNEPYRIEIVTPTHITRLDVSGLIHITDASGHDRYASAPRSKHMFDQIAAIVKALNAGQGQEHHESGGK